MRSLLAVVIALILFSCNSQKKYTEFDISYSRSGGYAPVYENLLLNGTKAHYSFEGNGKSVKKDFRITEQERKEIENAIEVNNFRTIREDYKKVYDNITTSINIRHGGQSASKSDGSFIMEADQQRWNAVVKVFQDLIKSRNLQP